jgi:fatty-acyl-CoA synthase
VSDRDDRIDRLERRVRSLEDELAVRELISEDGPDAAGATGDADTTVRHLLLARATDHGAALRFEGRTWSWAEHVAESARRSRWLLERLDPDRPAHVGVLLENVPEFSFLLGAAGLSGITLVGLNPTRSAPDLRRDVEHTDCQLVLTDLGCFGWMGRTDLGDVEVLDVGTAGHVAALAAYDDRPPGIGVGPEATLLLIFTSGTTSAPKAVICSQRKIAWTAASAAARRYRPGDVAYSAMPLFHSGAIMAVWAPMLAVGGTVVLRRRFSASAYIDDVRTHGCTIAHYVGKPLAYVLAQPEGDDDADNPLRAVFGNEGAAHDIVEFSRRFDCEVFDGYGSTELGISIRRVDGTPPQAMGRPTGGDVRVVDPDTGRECAPARFGPDGTLLNADEAVGELVRLDGPGLFEGYYANPEADRERYRDGVFHSGDLAYRDTDGFFYFAGRTGEWLRVDGENLAVAPIERALSELEGVLAVAVFAVPDPQVGDVPMAAMVPGPGRRVDAGALDAWWAARADLSSKARPRFVRVTDQLEQTATYKTVKRGMAAERWECADPVYWAPDPDVPYRLLTDTDRAGLREAFTERGRAHLLSS